MDENLFRSPQTLQISRIFPFLASRTFSASSSNGVNRAPGSAGEPNEIIDDGNALPPIPTHKERHGESPDVLKARLVYQSRKRGTLENGIILRFVPDTNVWLMATHVMHTLKQSAVRHLATLLKRVLHKCYVL